MSHFSVIVITPPTEDFQATLERQLQPYHEFECTGQDDEFVQDVDKTEDARAQFFEEKTEETFAQWAEGWYGIKPIPFGAPKTEDHKYGRIELDASGEVVRIIDRTNPNKKWDWWQVGGRYSNRLLLRDGTKCDSALKRDIDFTQMALNKVADAANEWNIAQSAFGDTPPCESWESVRTRNEGNIEKAREEYNEQPRVKAWNANSSRREVFGFFSGPDDYQMPLSEYLKPKSHALTGFAVVKEGKWLERGEMGWFACVSNEEDEGTWNARVTEILTSVPDDHTITIVDCHI